MTPRLVPFLHGVAGGLAGPSMPILVGGGAKVFVKRSNWGPYIVLGCTGPLYEAGVGGSFAEVSVGLKVPVFTRCVVLDARIGAPFVFNQGASLIGPWIVLSIGVGFR